MTADGGHPALEELQLRLEQEQGAYAEVLAAVDALASFALPAEAAPETRQKLEALNALWPAVPPPPAGGGLAGALRRRAFQALAPALARQEQFNAALVQLLNARLAESDRLHARPARAGLGARPLRAAGAAAGRRARARRRRARHHPLRAGARRIRPAARVARAPGATPRSAALGERLDRLRPEASSRRCARSADVRLAFVSPLPPAPTGVADYTADVLRLLAPSPRDRGLPRAAGGRGRRACRRPCSSAARRSSRRPTRSGRTTSSCTSSATVRLTPSPTTSCRGCPGCWCCTTWCSSTRARRCSRTPSPCAPGAAPRRATRLARRRGRSSRPGAPSSSTPTRTPGSRLFAAHLGTVGDLLPYAYPLLRIPVEASRAVLVHSAYAAEIVRGEVADAALATVPQPVEALQVDGEAVRRLRARLGFTPEHVVVGCFGLLTREKRIDAIAGALARASAHRAAAAPAAGRAGARPRGARGADRGARPRGAHRRDRAGAARGARRPHRGGGRRGAPALAHGPRDLRRAAARAGAGPADDRVGPAAPVGAAARRRAAPRPGARGGPRPGPGRARPGPGGAPATRRSRRRPTCGARTLLPG